MKKKSPPRHMGRALDGAVPTVGKMLALLDYYDIRGGLGDPDAVWLLAFMLTRDHHVKWPPIHRTRKRPPHRPHDLTVGFRDLHIFRELERVRRQGGQVVWAANELSKRWRKEDICHWSGESLRRRYYQIRRTIRRTGGPPKGVGIAAIKEIKSSSASKI